MYSFVFTKNAKKQFDKIYEVDTKRILLKLNFLKTVSDIYDYIKVVKNLKPSTHRIRIGSFRLLISIDGNNIIIFKIGHRRDIYK